MNEPTAEHLTTREAGPCPAGDELSDYLAGNLTGERIDEIAAHTSECARCLALLGELNNQSDTFIRRIRRGLFRIHGPEQFRKLLGRIDEKFGLDLSWAWDGPEPRSEPSAADPAPRVQIPSQLGQYQLLEVLGQGGMGIVYRARHVSLKRERALKLMHPRRLPNVRDLRRFYQEIEAVGRLDQHPNIIVAHDAAEAEGFHFLVMELVEGITVAKLLERTGPLSIADACELCRQAAVGLDYACEHGIVHRDIKPSNLFLSTKGILKILDLGLVSFTGPDTERGAVQPADEVLGTSDYMAPEQWTGCAAVDTRADIYSLGCTLFQLLAGSAPYRAVSQRDGQKAEAHRSAPIPVLRDQRSEVTAPLQAIVERMLAKRAADRFRRPAEVVQALEPFCKGSNLELLASRALSAENSKGRLPPPPGPTPVSSRSASRSWRRRGFVVAVAGTVAAGSAVRFGRWRSQELVWYDLPIGSNQPRFLVSDKSPGATWARSGSDGIRINADKPALLWLAEAPGIPFRLRLSLLLSRGVRRAGIFFGFNPILDSDGLIYQTLELRHIAVADKYSMRWTELMTPSQNDVWPPHEMVLSYGPSMDILGNQPHPLELTVGPQGVAGVRLDGRNVPKAVLRRHDLQPRATRFEGGCGLLVEGGQAIFARPQMERL